MLCLNIKPNEGFLVFYKRGVDGKPVTDPKTVSVLCVDNLTERRTDSQVQVNYECPLRVIRNDLLSEPKNRELGVVAERLVEKIDDYRAIDMIEGGTPLAMFERGMKAPIFDQASISMISLGKEFGRFGDRVLEVRYFGPLNYHSYEEVLTEPRFEAVIENVMNVYRGMRGGLEKRQAENCNARKLRRKLKIA